jgi:FMN phosphatase YigB (HAD superfamily)
MIKLIVFDLMNTLAFKNVNYSVTDTLHEISDLPISRQKFAKMMERSTEIQKWRSKKSAYKNLCINLGLQPTESNIKLLLKIKDRADSKVKLFDFTLKLLKKIRKQGYKIGLITNNNVFQKKYVQKTSILNFVDYPLFSHQVGVVKPDLRIFRKMIKISDCKAGDILMIGDSLTDDIIPARKLGMKTIYFKNIVQLKKNLKSFDIEA